MSFGETVSMVWIKYWPLIIMCSAILGSWGIIIFIHLKYMDSTDELLCCHCGHHWESNVWDARAITKFNSFPKCPLCGGTNISVVERTTGDE